ncbi:hypothetical protein Slala05_71890 [Streptomyces lavendulae subsp. lavendulae]|nr:hypothetical protein Slala05_71890 [Streptomyces lavendulae subsp. lavendulae]
MHQVQHLPVRSRMPVPFRFGDLLQGPDRLAQPGPELFVDQGVRLPHPVDGGHLDARPPVPQPGVVPEFSEHVPDLCLGEPLGDRLLPPPRHDAGIVHLLEPPRLRPDVRAALHHLQLPQRPGFRERDGARRFEGQRKGRQAGQL